MNKPFIPILFIASLFVSACSDDESSPWETYKGYFTESEGGMMYDFFQEPDTTVLVLNASNVPCDSTETIEEVPCGDSPYGILSFGLAGEATNALVDDAEVVAFHLFREIATGYELSGFIRKCHESVKDFVGTFAYQSDFHSESLKV